MGHRRQPPVDSGIHDVNMTPLIDVSLVLVVILMIATPLAFQSSIALKNAAASGRSAEVTARSERIELTVLSEDLVQVNQRIVPRAALEETLRPLVGSSATRLVVVRCLDPVTHATFVSVLDQARSAGASRIAVVER